MKSVWATVLLMIVASAGWSQAARSKADGPAQDKPRVVTMTRQMAVFSQLEDEVAKGAAHKDQAALDKLLGDEFQVWMPSSSGYPKPREDWEKDEGQCAASKMTLTQFATRVFGDVTVVNFRMTRRCKGKTQPEAWYVVDVWQKAGEGWKLVDRSVSATTAAKTPVRPTGKQ